MDQPHKTYTLHCNRCNFKRFSNGRDIDDLVQIKLSDVPRNEPKFDPFTKKLAIAPDKKRTKMFKCPKCGHTIRAYLIGPEEQNEQTNNPDGCETGNEGQQVP